MEINLSKKKKWILRIICICVLLQLPIVYFMDKFYYFNDDNIRYTIGTYYKEGVIVNSSSNKEKDLFIMLIVLNMLQQQVNLITQIFLIHMY